VGCGAEPRLQTHSGEFLAAEKFLMATIFTILVYERCDEIAVLTLMKDSC